MRAAIGHHISTDGSTIDHLFVSHLHSDHLNGLERLMAVSRVHTVIVPYLDEIDLLMVIAADDTDQRLSWDLIQYAQNPDQWWKGRGAERVIFVNPDNGDGSEPDVPPDPIEPERPRTFEPREEAKIQDRFRLPYALGGGSRRVHSGSAFVVVSNALGGSTSDWSLIPYTHWVPTEAKKAFKNAVTKLLVAGGVSGGLQSALVNVVERKKLVDLYSSFFGMKQNAISMSLYSGPVSSHEYQVALGDEDWWTDNGAAVSWLTTGDSELKQATIREHWLKFFGRYQDLIGFLSLPHHGSWRNFHPEILRVGSVQKALATTIERRNRVSRLRETIQAVELAGVSVHVVDDRPHTKFDLRVAR